MHTVRCELLRADGWPCAVPGMRLGNVSAGGGRDKLRELPERVREHAWSTGGGVGRERLRRTLAQHCAELGPCCQSGASWRKRVDCGRAAALAHGAHLRRDDCIFHERFHSVVSCTEPDAGPDGLCHAHVPGRPVAWLCVAPTSPRRPCAYSRQQRWGKRRRGVSRVFRRVQHAAGNVRVADGRCRDARKQLGAAGVRFVLLQQRGGGHRRNCARRNRSVRGDGGGSARDRAVPVSQHDDRSVGRGKTHCAGPDDGHPRLPLCSNCFQRGSEWAVRKNHVRGHFREWERTSAISYIVDRHGGDGRSDDDGLRYCARRLC